MSTFEWMNTTPLGEWLLTLLVSMVPVLELRGGIPFGIALGLDPWASFFASVIGNLIPIPFIILFIRRILSWMRQWGGYAARFSEWLERHAINRSEQVRKYQLLGLCLFVAIPLPGTGAWTGALIAALLNIRLKSAFPTIGIGVLMAGFLILGLTYGFTAIFLT